MGNKHNIEEMWQKILTLDNVDEMLRSKDFFEGYDYTIEKTNILIERCSNISEKAELYKKLCSLNIFNDTSDISTKNEIVNYVHFSLLQHFEKEIDNLSLIEYKKIYESLTKIGELVEYQRVSRQLLILRVELKWKEKTFLEFSNIPKGDLIRIFSLCKNDDPMKYLIAKELNNLASMKV